MKDLFQNLDLASLASRVRSFTTNLQDYQMVTPSLARVVISLTGTMPQREEIRASVVDLFKGKATPVQNSFREITTMGGIKIVAGFVKSGAEVMMMDEAKGKMKAMASNLLMDETDKSMWEIRSGGGNTQYLVKQGQEDLSELAYNITSRKTGLPKLDSLASVPTEAKEFAAWVDTKVEEVMYGYVLASKDDKSTVLAYGEEEPTEIESAQLVHVLNFEGADTKELGMEMAASVSGDRAAMVEYYKKAYKYSPDYVQKIIEMIDQHAFA